MRKQTTMRIVRSTLLGLPGLVAAAWLAVSLIAGGQETGQVHHQMPMPGKGMMTKDHKIANAMTAAPASVSAKATMRTSWRRSSHLP